MWGVGFGEWQRNRQLPGACQLAAKATPHTCMLMVATTRLPCKHRPSCKPAHALTVEDLVAVQPHVKLAGPEALRHTGGKDDGPRLQVAVRTISMLGPVEIRPCRLLHHVCKCRAGAAVTAACGHVIAAVTELSQLSKPTTHHVRQPHEHVVQHSGTHVPDLREEEVGHSTSVLEFGSALKGTVRSHAYL